LMEEEEEEEEEGEGSLVLFPNHWYVCIYARLFFLLVLV
jgi:hypothetical protein